MGLQDRKNPRNIQIEVKLNVRPTNCNLSVSTNFSKDTYINDQQLVNIKGQRYFLIRTKNLNNSLDFEGQLLDIQ